MQIKIAVLAILAMVAFAHGLPYGYEDNGHAHYKFAYGVHDPHTHDVKSQEEYRHGGHLNGGYALEDPDGTRRVVKYVASPHGGFEAVVERIGYAHHPAAYGHGHHGGVGGTSYVGVTHWGDQGPEEHGY